MTIALFDFSHAPFDSLDVRERELIGKSVDVEYFPEGGTVVPADAPVEALYVLIKGIVGEQEQPGSNDAAIVYTEHDSFDSRSLISGRSDRALLALEDALAFRIPREVVLDLIRRNPTFGAYFYQDVAKRLAALANQPQRQAMQSMMLARVEQTFIRPPLWLEADASVLDAARLMREAHTTSVLVRNADGAPGIFTQSNLRDFVIDGQDAATARVADLARYELYSVDAHAPVTHAMLVMARHTIQRVVVLRDAAIIGVLEQIDLLSFLTRDSHMVTAQIERARTLDDLHEAWRNTDPLIALMHQNGVKVTLIAELMHELRDKFLLRLFELIAPPEILPHVCLLVLGSEGRGEQILKTDQDNALIIEDGYTHPQLAEVCERFNATLIEFGYPVCPGDIMVRNPFWRRAAREYKRLINDWMDSASGENVMQLAIWVDAWPICGNHALFDDVKTHWLNAFRDNAAFLSRFALPVEQFETPLNVFSRLVADKGEERNLLDLKKGGIFPLVHGVRSMALEAGIPARNTYLRVDQLVQRAALTTEMAQDVVESLAFLQGLQLKYGLQKIAKGRPMDNLIDPRRLTTLERDLLKDTLAVVKRFRQMLRHRYRLNAL